MMQGITIHTLGKCVCPVATWNPIREAVGREIRYIDLSSVDNQTKLVTGHQVLLGEDAPSRARQLVQSDDIIVSTVRPNLNGVARISTDLDGATVSTGFCVLRTKKDILLPEYLFQWVKSPSFIDEMVRRATGASYPAVSDKIIFETEILLPALPEQKRIAAILDQADELRRKRQRTIDRLGQLSQAIFYEMFGNPVMNEFSWPQALIRNAGIKLSDGNYSSKYPSQEDFVEDGVPFIRANNIKGGTITNEDMRFISINKHKELQKGHLKAEDVLITTRGQIGNVCLVPDQHENSNINAQIVLLRSDGTKIDQRFLFGLLSTKSMQNVFESLQTGVALKQLPVGKLKEVAIIMPPLEQQAEFAAANRKLAVILAQCLTSMRRENDLFASLQHRAFSGELTATQAERELAEAG